MAKELSPLTMAFKQVVEVWEGVADTGARKAVIGSTLKCLDYLLRFPVNVASRIATTETARCLGVLNLLINASFLGLEMDVLRQYGLLSVAQPTRDNEAEQIITNPEGLTAGLDVFLTRLRADIFLRTSGIARGEASEKALLVGSFGDLAKAWGEAGEGSLFRSEILADLEVQTKMPVATLLYLMGLDIFTAEPMQGWLLIHAAKQNIERARSQGTLRSSEQLGAHVSQINSDPAGVAHGLAKYFEAIEEEAVAGGAKVTS